MRTVAKQTLLSAAIFTAALVVLPVPVRGQAIRTNPEFSQYSIPANDDGSSPSVPLGFTVNFFGRTGSSVYVNNNGNVTFDQPLSTYTPFGLEGTHREIIAAFFADVDTRPKTSKLTTYGRSKINNHAAFGVNYLNVGYYDQHSDKLNSFQLILIDRSDTGAGNFDIEFNYEKIAWETGDASSGTNGYGGVSAAIGWSNGTGDPGTSWQLEGSLIPGSFLDSASRALVGTRYNSTTVGRYQFRARGGILIPGLSIQTGCPVPNATAGNHYRYPLEASGEKGPYNWTILPDPGMTLPIAVSAGALSGDPKDPGTYNFTLQATAKTDDGDVTVVKRCSLTVDPPQLTIRSACPLPGAVAGAAYSQNFTAAGGNAPYTWTLIGNTAPGLTLNANGTLAGTPAVAGTYLFAVRAAGADGVALPAERQCSIVVQPSAPTPAVSACPARTATQGVPYTATLGVSGGNAPYTWSLYGQLPSGLTMNSAGGIGGIPDAAGVYTFRLIANDSRGQSATQDCAISVKDPELKLTPACPLPAATAGLPYSQRLNASGGSTPYAWTVATGTLPAGLRLSSDGLISGTPSVAGPSLFRLVATDPQGFTAGTACSLAVARPSLSIASCPLPPAVAGTAYDATLNAIGGTAPYLWSLDGSLPAGLTLLGSGRISGTPATSGSYSFTLRAIDGRGQSVSQSCSVAIEPPLPNVITECPLPRAEIGKTYSYALAANGGTPPYRWFVDGGLPPDLSLAADGTLSGVPSKQGNYPFTLLGSDSRNRAIARACSLAVSLPTLPTVTLSDVPAVVAPATSNVATGVELGDAYSLPIQGTAALTVVPQTGGSAEVNQADPLVRLANNQQTIRFTIPAGARKLSIPVVSSGTVAGTVTFAVKSLEVAGNKLSYVPSAKVFSIAPAAPVMTAACFTGSATSVVLTVTGYSTTRQIDTAEITLDGKTLSQNVKPSSSDYFTNDLSVRTGGAFTLTLPGIGTTATPSSVAITLINSAGRSANRTASRCQ